MAESFVIPFHFSCICLDKAENADICRLGIKCKRQIIQKILRFQNNAVYLQSDSKEEDFGVWRSWLAHLVWDQRVLCSSHSTPT